MFPYVWFAGWILEPLVGLAVAGWGFHCLLHLIPQTHDNPNVRTDIFLLKASYWSIIVGLLCIAVWVLAAIFVDSVVILKAFHISR